MGFRDDQIRDLVIRTLLGESNGTPEGMISVAHVMKNRADSGAWGDRTSGGLTHLITAHKQFSMWNNDDPKLRALAAGVNAIPTSDPRYQRAAAIADGVFGDQIPDNTNGATFYHTPSVSPDWSQGQTPVATIGGHYFYKLPLTASNTAGTAVVSPSTVGMGGMAAPAPAPAAGGFVYGGESPQDQGVDVRHLEPVFAVRIAKLQADAAAAGIKTHLTDGYRDNQSQAADYAKQGAQHLAAAPGQSYHQFGRAVDLVADNPAQQAALVALADQPGRGIVAGAHFQTPDRVHFQAAEGKTAPLLEAGASAPAKPIGQGGIGSDASAPLGTASPGPPAVSTIVPNPANIPAVNAQPVSATAPANPSAAGYVGPGSDKVSLVKSITSGTSHNPQITTAANWGNLFGGAGPAASPAAAPAAAAPAAPASVPASAPAPAPAPTPSRNAWNDRPSGVPDSVRNAWSDRPSGVPGSPIAAAEVVPPAPAPAPAPAPPPTLPQDDVQPQPWPTLNDKPYGGHSTNWGPPPPLPLAAKPWDRPITAPPAPVVPPDAPRPPAMHPWDLPMSLNQPTQIPGSMLASAQNLIRLLFPSNVG